MNIKRAFKFYTVLIIAVLFYTNTYSAPNITFFSDGKTDYVILVPLNSSDKLRNAVDNLRDYLKKMTGIMIPCTDNTTAKCSYIIFEEGKSSDKTFNTNILKEDGFRIKTVNNYIYFTARSGQGLINAVYTFLDKYLGCRYYSSDALYVPHKGNIKLPSINDVQNPSLNFRVVHYHNAYDKDYATWHKLNNSTEQRISNEWGLWVHTMLRLVSPEKYFATHPEYFAYRNGTRVRGQLCLSNPEVVKITIESLKKLMRENPKAKYWSVSQMDNEQYCQCNKCRAIDSLEGSHSGSIIHFMNKLAVAFPNKTLSTLAYKYSRTAPKYVRPAKNVNIVLSTYEATRNKPIESENTPLSIFHDLKSWKKITNNIMIWDYVTNFSHLLSPFPNFQTLKPNINLFVNNNAKMIFEQGYPGVGGEFNELRCYILAKLLWNPNEDIDNLMNDFLTGYYGAAVYYIRQYIDISRQAIIDSDIPLTMYDHPAIHKEGYLSPTMLNKYIDIFNKALESVKDNEVLSSRVERAYQPVRYAWLEVCKEAVFTNDWIFTKEFNSIYKLKPQASSMLEQFYKIASKYGPETLHEDSYTPLEYYTDMKNYFNNAIVQHLAVGKKITFETQYANAYQANGPNSLIDGVRGTEDYQILWQGWQGEDVVATIDLESSQDVKQIEVTCLDDESSRILAPESIKIEVSNDGSNYTNAGFYANASARLKLPKQIVKFSVPLKQKFLARFIKVTIKNIGKLPAWRGMNADTWLFVDEIVVK